MAAYPSGDPIGVLLVAYLHLTTTPAGEVQCRPSRASILQHAGLESSPSISEVHDDGAPAEGLQYDGDGDCATAICNYSGDDKVTTAVADASSMCDGWQDETARASSAASERALVAGRFRGDVNGAVVGRVALAPPAPRVQ
jgi:hypothetical protein